LLCDLLTGVLAVSHCWQEEEDDEGFEFECGWECGYNFGLDHLEADVRMHQVGGDLQQQCPDADAAAVNFPPAFQKG
jgi:hypothetical protein